MCKKLLPAKNVTLPAFYLTCIFNLNHLSFSPDPTVVVHIVLQRSTTFTHMDPPTRSMDPIRRFALLDPTVGDHISLVNITEQ